MPNESDELLELRRANAILERNLAVTRLELDTERRAKEAYKRKLKAIEEKITSIVTALIFTD